MDLRRIRSVSDPLFGDFWALYEDSFPLEERRGLDYQIETLSQSAYRLEALLLDGEFVGFIGWWDLLDFRYIEHLATSASVRGLGYGRLVLQQFFALDSKPILIEVEHPISSINQRRIAFYERQGFVMNPYDYSYPPYGGGAEPFVNLLVMTYPVAITHEQLEKFKLINFPIVHFRYFR